MTAQRGPLWGGDSRDETWMMRGKSKSSPSSRTGTSRRPAGARAADLRGKGGGRRRRRGADGAQPRGKLAAGTRGPVRRGERPGFDSGITGSRGGTRREWSTLSCWSFQQWNVPKPDGPGLGLGLGGPNAEEASRKASPTRLGTPTTVSRRSLPNGETSEPRQPGWTWGYTGARCLEPGGVAPAEASSRVCPEVTPHPHQLALSTSFGPQCFS